MYFSRRSFYLYMRISGQAYNETTEPDFNILDALFLDMQLIRGIQVDIILICSIVPKYFFISELKTKMLYLHYHIYICGG